MNQARFGVGIIGLEPGRSWAAAAHLPALQALPNDFTVAGVANSSPESSARAAAATGLRAFASVDELVASPDVDIVAVTVKVPHHLALVSAAIAAGKHVYCEWPLGNGLAEGRELAALAKARGVLGVVGTQAPFAPEVERLRELLGQGYVGEVLSTTLVGTGLKWGTEIEPYNAYILDRRMGATMLSIPVGHTLAALISALGPFASVSATLLNRRHSSRNTETGATVPMTAHDQVLFSGVLESGAAISVHYRGGTARGDGLLWEINGAQGDLKITGPGGHSQMMPLFLHGGRGDDASLAPIAVKADPDGGVVGNVRRVYAAMASDLRTGTRLAPSFDQAVDLHRTIEAIERSAEQGRRVDLSEI
jgi:predicted dehydrogenase